MAEQKFADDIVSSDLISTTVHELKSPLTLISGLSSMLKLGDFGEISSQQEHYIHRIMLTSDRLLTLVDSLLSVGKYKRDSLELDLEPISAASLVRQVCVELEPLLREKKLTFSVQRPRQLPPVMADRQALYQVLYNLVDNAIKYSREEGRIKIHYKHEEDKLRISIIDEGVGVSQKDIERVFKQFGTSRQPIQAHAGSSGLGLYIVKNLMDALGGEIHVKTLENGSCFYILLPIARQLSLFSGEVIR